MSARTSIHPSMGSDSAYTIKEIMHERKKCVGKEALECKVLWEQMVVFDWERRNSELHPTITLSQLMATDGN